MKKTVVMSKFIPGVLLLALALFFCFNPSISRADAPKDVKIEYETATQTLAITITHKSLFPKMHHIKTVEIKKNTAVISSTDYTTQPKEVPYTYTYKLAAAQGDKLEVTVTCNMSGSKTVTAIVHQPPSSKADPSLSSAPDITRAP